MIKWQVNTVWIAEGSGAEGIVPDVPCVPDVPVLPGAPTCPASPASLLLLLLLLLLGALAVPAVLVDLPDLEALLLRDQEDRGYRECLVALNYPSRQRQGGLVRLCPQGFH